MQGPVRAGPEAARRTSAGARSGAQVQSRRGSSAGTRQRLAPLGRVAPAADEGEVRARGPRRLARAVEIAEADDMGRADTGEGGGDEQLACPLGGGIGMRRRGRAGVRQVGRAVGGREDPGGGEEDEGPRPRRAPRGRARRGAAPCWPRMCAAGVMPSVSASVVSAAAWITRSARGRSGKPCRRGPPRPAPRLAAAPVRLRRTTGRPPPPASRPPEARRRSARRRSLRHR